jgi:putative membrane protein
MNPASYRRHFWILVTIFTVLWIALAIHPNDRKDWLLENALVAVGVAALFATRKRFLLSRLSYTLIFFFLCLHEIGAHYTYAEVPYDVWFKALTGRTFNSLIGWDRNNFDRIVHFLYGFLLSYPIRELFLRVVNVRGFWGYFLPLDVTMSTSMIYELIEWAVAVQFGGGLGAAYLGTQGDEWDAQKDMAMASLGALIAMCITAAVNARLQRDFAREWAESIRVKRPEPLGEEELGRMLDRRENGGGH